MFPWFWYHFRTTFRIWGLRNVRVHALLCPMDYLWTPPIIQEDLANGRPNLDCHSSFYFVFGFLGVVHFSFQGPVRHFALGLDLMRTNPAMSMLKTNCYQNWRTTREQTRGTKFLVFHIIVFTRRNIRGLRRVFQATERQAFLRVIALSRRDQDRERKLVLPRLFAHLHWPLPPQWCSWIVAKYPVHLSLILFLLTMCIDAPESTTNSCSSGLCEVGACITLASKGE